MLGSLSSYYRNLPEDIPFTWDFLELLDPDEVFGGPEVSDRLKRHEIQKGDIIFTPPSQWVEYAFQIFDKAQHKLVAFPFTNRKYLKEVYDSQSKSFVMLFGRQSEKCCKSAKVLSFSGELLEIQDIRPGDALLSMDESFRVVPQRVTRTYKNGKQNFIRITTRLGHKLEVTRSHPIRTLYGMTPAGELKVKDRVAGIFRGGVFGRHTERDSIIKLVPYLIGDGSTGVSKNFSYTQLPGKPLEEFKTCCLLEGIPTRVEKKKDSKAYTVNLSQNSEHYLVRLLKEDDLWGHRSYEKFIPSWVYSLSREDTSLFLNRLWSTDGHVKRNSRAQYEISYSSSSERLLDGVQALLWKFGVPTRRVPYKPKGGRLSWKLYVQTQQGIRTFLEEIGALGKSEDVPFPAVSTNNNRYTIPKEINKYLKDNIRKTKRDGQSATTGGGLERVKLKYAPSPEKLAKYAAYIDREGGDAQFLWDLIEGDILWDTVVSIEDIGEDDAYDIEVEDTHNYVANGIVTHNSTTLGNLAITHCCLMPFLHVLYISPSANQTKVFSKDRIKEPIEASPMLRAFTSKSLTQNVFEKTFSNRATVILRYAFYTADRSRGIAADVLLIDELQDMLQDNIPVLEETMTHSDHKLQKRYYAGTPKTRENTLGTYWGYSTQNEWAIPCDCTLPNRYWNILDSRNIGLSGPICKGCGKSINPYHEDAQWASASRHFPDGAPREFEGYRVPQIMVPIHQGEGWPAIVRKKTEYPTAQFDNEVMAIFSEGGDRPITRDELIATCSPLINPREVAEYEAYLENIRQMTNGGAITVCAGIDWGSGDASAGRTGYTVLSLGSYLGGEDFTIFYMKRFEGEESDPNRQLTAIIEILRAFNVKIVGVDQGFGFMQNSTLQESLAYRRGVVVRFLYAGNPGKKARYNPDHGCYVLHRSSMMSNMFNVLKKAKATGIRSITLPCWEWFERPFGVDVLSIFTEYNDRTGLLKYDHPLDRPDDSFHSLLYCMMASVLHRPRRDLFGITDLRTGD